VCGAGDFNLRTEDGSSVRNFRLPSKLAGHFDHRRTSLKIRLDFHCQFSFLLDVPAQRKVGRPSQACSSRNFIFKRFLNPH
jgi:hypothetical protein